MMPDAEGYEYRQLAGYLRRVAGQLRNGPERDDAIRWAKWAWHKSGADGSTFVVAGSNGHGEPRRLIGITYLDGVGE